MALHAQGGGGSSSSVAVDVGMGVGVPLLLAASLLGVLVWREASLKQPQPSPSAMVKVTGAPLTQFSSLLRSRRRLSDSDTKQNQVV